MIINLSLFTLAAPAVRAAVKPSCPADTTTIELFWPLLVFDWLAGSNQVINLGEKDGMPSKVAFRCELIPGAFSLGKL